MNIPFVLFVFGLLCLLTLNLTLASIITRLANSDSEGK